MPYASVSDVPSYVPTAKRAQWREVWNSAHAKALSDGKSPKDAEASAFAQANGVVKKESGMFKSLFAPHPVKVTESALPMNQSHDALRGHIQKALNTAHGASDSYSANSPSLWQGGVFPNHVVYAHGGQLYKRSYTADQGAAGSDPTIKLGAQKPVHAAYVESKAQEAESVLLMEAEAEADEGEADVVAVRESVVFEGAVTLSVKESTSKVPIKIIGPGWGSSAYYSKEMLKRDGPKVFTAGTHMMWNHATSTEESERPEGNLDNLAAVLTKNAEWRETGPKGAGLYSEAKVFSDYAQKVAEKGSHIGVSINAAIRGHEGEMEGRRGRIAESFVKAFSTDFVTKAGAGGAPVVPVTESQRGHLSQESTMTEQEVKEKADLQTENTALKARLAKVEESQNHVLAIATVGAVLKEAGISFSRPVLERVCTHPTMKEGKCDPEWVKGVVKDLAEGQDGHIEGFGEHHTHESEATAKSTDERLKKALEGLGVPAKGIDYAVAGRV